MFEHGIVVGKFAPLHKGHEWLINAALAQCKKVSVISYCKPEYTGCEARRRLGWIQTLFPGVNAVVFDEHDVQQWRNSGWKWPMPENTAPDIRQREFVAELLWQRQWHDVDAVFSSEHYGDGFAAYLQQFFTRQQRSRHQVQHVCVDQARSAVSASGTAIRSDIHASRQWLSPVVYGDFVQRVVFIGGESSGKSTLAQTLALRYHSQWVPEFGRYWWLLKNGELSRQDYLHIAREQTRLEQVAAQQANRFLFCDTNAIVTLCYYEDQFGERDAELLQHALHPCDLLVLCASDFDFVQDGSRRTAEFSAQQFTWYQHFLQQQNMSYVAISGSLNERIEQVEQMLNSI